MLGRLRFLIASGHCEIRTMLETRYNGNQFGQQVAEKVATGKISNGKFTENGKKFTDILIIRRVRRIE